MLTNSLSTTQVGQCRYTPGRGGGRRAAPFKDLRPPGPSGGRALCAPSHQRQYVASPAPVVVSSAGSGDHDIRYFHRGSVRGYSWAQSATTQSPSASRPSSPAFSLSAMQASCRLTQLRCWVVPGRDSSSSASSVRRVPSLHSSVSLRLVYTWPLFLHTSAGVNPAGSVPGVQEAARWAAGADSVGTSPPQTAPVLPHQRCWRHTSIRRSVPVREDRLTPHQRQCVAHTVSRSGSGPGGRLSTLRGGLFRCSREPKVSLPRRSRARRTHTCQTASRATLHSLRSFRALGHWETLSRASARTVSRKRTTSHASTTRLRDSQQPRPTRKLTPQPQCVIHRHHPPDEEEKGINIYNRRSAACAAPLRFQ